MVLLSGAEVPVPLQSLLDRRAVVLLGDPGQGKSTSLKSAAALFGCGHWTVRGFLALNGSPARAGHLFLDGLDETMAARRSDAPLDEVVRLLQSEGWPAFWLTCRPADWAQAGGRALLEECSPGGLALARLLPLSEEQIAGVVEAAGLDPAVVLGSMADAGLQELLGNPETLRLTVEVFAEGGPPASRADLYLRATRQLARECNREHARRPGRPTDAQLLDAAGALSAMLLLTGKPAVASRGAEASDAVPLEACDGLAAPGHLEAALGSRLFRAVGDDAWEPAHRTIAEFVAAGFLAARVAQGGRPLRTVLALVCGDDAAPEPSLRGLFAWLAAALPDRAPEFVGRDPYAVATYGDLSALRLPGRRALFAGLTRLAETEPFFRAGAWHEARFGALSTAELVPELREVIAARPVRLHLLSCILDALEARPPRPELAPDLAALVLAEDVDPDVRDAAASAFAKAASPSEAAALFEKLLRDDRADPRGRFAGRLLLRLYPESLGGAELAAFLDRYASTDGGRGDRLHLALRLPPLVPSGEEADLLDRLSSCRRAADRSQPLSRIADIKRIAARLAARALAGPAAVDATRATSWLPLLGGAGRSGPEADELRAALSARPDLYIPFLLAAFRQAEDRLGERPWFARWHLCRALPSFEPPPDAAERALDAVLADPDGGDAIILYASALQLLPSSADACSPLFGRAWEMRGLHPEFARHWDEVMTVPTDGQEWRREDRERTAGLEREEAEAAARELAFFEGNLEAIRTGRHVLALGRLAFAFFRGAGTSRREMPPNPRDRLRAVVTEEVALAAEAGFREHVLTGHLTEPAELARRAVASGQTTGGLVALAGADLLHGDGEPLPNRLEPTRCARLLCLGLVQRTATVADGIETADGRAWLRQVAEALPSESESAVRELLTAQLRAGAGIIDGLDEVCAWEGFETLRQALVPELLAGVSGLSPVFRTLRRAAVRSCDPGVIRPIVEGRLLEAEDEEERWPWLLLAWRLQPAAHEGTLVEACRRDGGLVPALTHDVGDERDGFDGEPGVPLTVRHRLAIVRLAGPCYPPAPMPEGTWSPPTPYDRARFVQRHIDGIAAVPTGDAEAALLALVEDPTLAAHGDGLRHALAAWRRTARLERREMPSLTVLARSLAGGPPATAAEVRAFTVAQLQGMNDVLRRDADGAWRAFWNVQAKSGPTEGRPENDCRDAVVRFLEARFEMAGLAQETEARRAGDTRCDIAVSGVDAVVPVEVKCDWNPELWTAWEGQLGEGYALDPRAGGFGIYLVIWFGSRRGKERRVAAPPSGPPPADAAGCQAVLDVLLSAHSRRLAAVVLDASPVQKRATRASARQGEAPPG